MNVLKTVIELGFYPTIEITVELPDNTIDDLDIIASSDCYSIIRITLEGPKMVVNIKNKSPRVKLPGIVDDMLLQLAQLAQLAHDRRLHGN